MSDGNVALGVVAHSFNCPPACMAGIRLADTLIYYITGGLYCTTYV